MRSGERYVPGICELDSNVRDGVIGFNGMGAYQHWCLHICKYRSGSANTEATLEGFVLQRPALSQTPIILHAIIGHEAPAGCPAVSDCATSVPSPSCGGRAAAANSTRSGLLCCNPTGCSSRARTCSTSSHHTCACRQILPRADAFGRLGRIHAHWSLVLPCLGGASANEICMEITPTPGDSTCRAQGGGTKCAATSHQIPTRRGGDHGQGAKARRILRRQNVHAGGNGAFVGRSIWPATQS